MPPLVMGGTHGLDVGAVVAVEADGDVNAPACEVEQAWRQCVRATVGAAVQTHGAPVTAGPTIPRTGSAGSA